MPQLFTNNARALLASGITDTATALTVEASKADLFPTANVGSGSVPSTNNWFKATLQDSAGNVEIVYVRTRTAGSGVFSNVIRGQEGTTARSFSAGTVVGLRITAADIEGSIATANNSVLLSKIQPIPSRHLIGRVSAGTGQAELVPLSSIVSSYSYDTRGDLRTLTNVAQDSLAVVDGLGLFQFSAGSDEPDDDESCFATATGRWLMQAPSWDVVAMWGMPDEAVQDENDEDEPLRFDARFPGSFDARFATRVLRGTALCAITSVATIGAASFTGAIAGAEVGDFVIATPPGELGATAADTARLAFRAQVTQANTVTITLTNASASTATTNAAIRANWPVAVIRNI